MYMHVNKCVELSQRGLNSAIENLCIIIIMRQLPSPVQTPDVADVAAIRQILLSNVSGQRLPIPPGSRSLCEGALFAGCPCSCGLDVFSFRSSK